MPVPLRCKGDAFDVGECEEKILFKAYFDGIYMVPNNAGFTPKEAAARYKSMWTVEHFIRPSNEFLDM